MRRRHILDIAVCSTTSRMHGKELQLHNSLETLEGTSAQQYRDHPTRIR